MTMRREMIPMIELGKTPEKQREAMDTQKEESSRIKLMGGRKDRSDSMKNGRKKVDEEDPGDDDNGRKAGRSPDRRDEGDRKRRDRGYRSEKDDRKRKERSGDD